MTERYAKLGRAHITQDRNNGEGDIEHDGVEAGSARSGTGRENVMARDGIEPLTPAFFRAGLAYQLRLSVAIRHRQIEQGSFSNEITLAPKGYLNACRLRLEFTW
jgi:hypothetical protein